MTREEYQYQGTVASFFLPESEPWLLPYWEKVQEEYKKGKRKGRREEGKKKQERGREERK